MEDVEVVAVPVEGHRVGEGDHGQRARRRRRGGPVEHFVELLDAHPFAHILVGDEDGAGLPHVFVAADVVAVPVRVDHEADRLVADRSDGGQDFLGQRGILIVDEEDTVVSDRDADVAATPDEHVDALGHVYDLDLYVIEVLLGESAGDEGHEGKGQQTRQ